MIRLSAGGVAPGRSAPRGPGCGPARSARRRRSRWSPAIGRPRSKARTVPSSEYGEVDERHGLQARVVPGRSVRVIGSGGQPLADPGPALAGGEHVAALLGVAGVRGPVQVDQQVGHGTRRQQGLVAPGGQVDAVAPPSPAGSRSSSYSSATSTSLKSRVAAPDPGRRGQVGGLGVELEASGRLHPAAAQPGAAAQVGRGHARARRSRTAGGRSARAWPKATSEPARRPRPARRCRWSPVASSQSGSDRRASTSGAASSAGEPGPGQPARRRSTTAATSSGAGDLLADRAQPPCRPPPRRWRSPSASGCASPRWWSARCWPSAGWPRCAPPADDDGSVAGQACSTSAWSTRSRQPRHHGRLPRSGCSAR